MHTSGIKSAWTCLVEIPAASSRATLAWDAVRWILITFELVVVRDFLTHITIACVDTLWSASYGAGAAQAIVAPF